MPIKSKSPDPTQQEIFDACTNIRKRWSFAERRRREFSSKNAEHVSESRRPESPASYFGSTAAEEF